MSDLGSLFRAGTSENTVKAHVKSILTKLDAIGRTEAIAIALKRGLIKPVH
jgi:DNA-binding CsgD family transcriptional regulator